MSDPGASVTDGVWFGFFDALTVRWGVGGAFFEHDQCGGIRWFVEGCVSGLNPEQWVKVKAIGRVPDHGQWWC